MLELEVVPERSLGCEQWEFILGKWRNTRDVSWLRRITRNSTMMELIHDNLGIGRRILVTLLSHILIDLYWCCCHVSTCTLLFCSICKHLVWQSRVNKENGAWCWIFCCLLCNCLLVSSYYLGSHCQIVN